MTCPRCNESGRCLDCRKAQLERAIKRLPAFVLRDRGNKHLERAVELAMEASA